MVVAFLSFASQISQARSLVQHTEDTPRLANTLLTGIVERAETPDRDDVALACLHLQFQHHLSETPHLHGLFVFDAKEHYLASSYLAMPRTSNLDRAYFQHYPKYTEKKAYVGPPLKNRTAGDWIVTVSKRIDNPDGSFAGVPLVTMRMEYFPSFQRNFDIGQGGVMFVALEDGLILIRRLFDDTFIGSIAAVPSVTSPPASASPP